MSSLLLKRGCFGAWDSYKAVASMVSFPLPCTAVKVLREALFPRSSLHGSLHYCQDFNLQIMMLNLFQGVSFYPALDGRERESSVPHPNFVPNPTSSPPGVLRDPYTWKHHQFMLPVVLGLQAS